MAPLLIVFNILALSLEQLLMSTPRDIKALTDKRVLRVVWTDGAVTHANLKYLREECRCAQCVDEGTGERILDPDSVPAFIGVRQMQLVGNYAVKITWSDGHDTGLYTWERLLELSDAAADEE